MANLTQTIPSYTGGVSKFPDDKKEPGTIIQEIQKGFMMKERLLRPALVGVAKKIAQKEKSKPNDEKDNENREN